MTHSKRKERRQQIATMISEGGSITEAMEKFNVGESVVLAAIKEFKASKQPKKTTKAKKEAVIRFTHSQRTDRRREMAEMVAEGNTVGKVSAYFGVSVHTVTLGCREHDVTVPSRPQMQARTYHIIADLINTNEPLSEIGRKYGVSAQWVSLIYKDCQQAGIAVQKRGQFGHPKTTSKWEEVTTCQ